jgi:ATP-dependent Clp protease ATP-binding subunit ClpA
VITSINQSFDEANKPASQPAQDLAAALSRMVIGQPAATRRIVPYVQMFQAGLAPEGRPVGVFLLLGPTGTGKTRTVEALAHALHGSEKNVLRIDCGEFQMEHEVAKLIGAPPGYLGHRETQPMLTQQKVNSVASENCGLSLVLFDEIEKAAPSMARLLLAVLDKGILRLGDNSHVNFERTLVFFTSNLGARDMMRQMIPGLGFQSAVPAGEGEMAARMERIGLSAVRRNFSPEFVNRIDCVITYQPLGTATLATILEQQISQLQQHIHARLGARSFQLEVTRKAREFLLAEGTSPESGAREIKRAIHRNLTQPIAALVASEAVRPGDRLRARSDGAGIKLQVMTRPREPQVLLVGSRRMLPERWESDMRSAGWTLRRAESAEMALASIRENRPDGVIVDQATAEPNGFVLALRLVEQAPGVRVALLAIRQPPPPERMHCHMRGIRVLDKLTPGEALLPEVWEWLTGRRPLARIA